MADASLARCPKTAKHNFFPNVFIHGYSKVIIKWSNVVHESENVSYYIEMWTLWPSTILICLHNIFIHIIEGGGKLKTGISRHASVQRTGTEAY